MKIYLDNRLLIQSTIFPKDELGTRLQFQFTEKASRDWSVYTFNSKDRLTDFEYNPENDNIQDIYIRERLIHVKLEHCHPFEFNEFESMNLPLPDNIIKISGYYSHIHTPFSIIKNLTNILEKNGVDCLVNNNVAPLYNHIFYESSNIKKQRENPIEIKL